MAEPLPQHGDELFADLVLFVVGFVFVAFLGAGVAADGGNVDHAVSVMPPIQSAQFSPLLWRRAGHIMASCHGMEKVIPELDECPPLHRTIDPCKVNQTKVCQLLVLFFAQPLDEAVTRQRDPHPVGHESIFGETEVEEGCYSNRRRAELFLLLDEVGAPDEADGTFVTQGGQELEHLRGDGLGDWGIRPSLRVEKVRMGALLLWRW